MSNPLFIGAGVAIITPFTESGVNYSKLEELIEFQLKNKMDSIIVCGTTGEASTMSQKEYEEVIKFALKIVDKRVPLIAGAGSNNTSHAIELSKFVQEAGVDGILSVTPYYNKTSQDGLFEHFKAISQSVDIPIILYNVPGRTGLNISPATTARLSNLNNIVGIKECNLSQFAETVIMCGENLSVYTGNDDQILPALSLGAKGAISAVANVIPGDIRNIVHEFLTGDVKKSIDMFLKTINFTKVMFCDVNPIAIKESLNILGYDVGKCRLPLVKTTNKNIELIKNALKDYNLL